MDVRNEILQIAQRYLRRIKRTGTDNIMAICPFHRRVDGSEERTPSFTMSLSVGLYICFSCKCVGNLYTFLRDVGVSQFIIDRQYRFVLTAAESNKPPAFNPKKPGVYAEDFLPESTLGLFDLCPIDLLNEGFDEKVLELFDVGFDTKNMRITYPLRDLGGKLIGISGRSVVEGEARYKVYDKEYAEWELPIRHTDKRVVLWNAHRVYPHVMASKEPVLVLVEGFKANMWLHQCGIPETMALLGSHMSREQQWMLERTGAQVYLFLDNDDAGRRGRWFIGEKLAQTNKVNIVEYDEEKPQPTDLQPDEVHNALMRAPDYFLWRMKGSEHGIRQG